MRWRTVKLWTNGKPGKQKTPPGLRRMSIPDSQSPYPRFNEPPCPFSPRQGGVWLRHTTIDALFHAIGSLSHASNTKTDTPTNCLRHSTHDAYKPAQIRYWRLSLSPPFPLYYLIPCAFLYIPKHVSLYPNRLRSSSCLSPNCEQVLCLPLNGQCASKRLPRQGNVLPHRQ